MLTKLVILAIALWVGWRLLRRNLTGARRARRERIEAIDAERCPACGVHRIPGRPCACTGLTRR